MAMPLWKCVATGIWQTFCLQCKLFVLSHQTDVPEVFPSESILISKTLIVLVRVLASLRQIICLKNVQKTERQDRRGSSGGAPSSSSLGAATIVTGIFGPTRLTERKTASDSRAVEFGFCRVFFSSFKHSVVCPQSPLSVSNRPLTYDGGGGAALTRVFAFHAALRYLHEPVRQYSAFTKDQAAISDGVGSEGDGGFSLQVSDTRNPLNIKVWTQQASAGSISTTSVQPKSKRHLIQNWKFWLDLLASVSMLGCDFF